MLKGVAGVANIADDLIIYRNCVEEHERRVYPAQTADRRLIVTSQYVPLIQARFLRAPID